MKKNNLLWIVILVFVAVLSIILSIMLGSVKISPADVFKSPIVLYIRLPRVIMAFITGAALSIVGLTFQSLLKNPLVDPYLIGVSSGASFGAALSFSIAESYGYFWASVAPYMAFVFGLFSAILAIAFSRKGKRISTTELVLAGVSMNMIFSSATVFLLYFFRRSSQGYSVWIFGSLSGVVWKDTVLPFLIFVLYLIFTYTQSVRLDAFSLGEDFAKIVGVETEFLKLTLFLSGVFLTATLVSKVGSIGFVGLVVPHIVRMLFGPSHKFSLLYAILVGGSFLVLVDLFSRIVAPPLEIPIGIVTSFVGVPVFLYIMKSGDER
ncbi:MAG: iron ABC transporter permease [Thermotogaceae bacterium]|nr:iron ABC transporter permease [Thermotogaceae bacterium]